VESVLMNYDFPGNIRELENIMQHAFVLCKKSVIQLSDLPKEVTSDFNIKKTENPHSLDDIEKKAIQHALLENSNKRKQTASQLGIDASTLYRKMKRYNIK
jgi:transcriptional regulator of acetoin/glycerol metabolism